MNPIMAGAIAVGVAFAIIVVVVIIQAMITFASDNPGIVMGMCALGALWVVYRFWR